MSSASPDVAVCICLYRFLPKIPWHLACFERGMNSGFYNAAIQMSTGSIAEMEAHSENLAHSTMPGYKRMEVNADVFAAMMNKEIPTQDLGSPIRINHEQGALRVTERPLDFAIEGDGFFMVSDGQREFLTRNGHFTMAADGTVVNSLGMPLQTSSGDLRIPRGFSAEDLVLDEKMNLRVGKKVIGQLKVVAVENPGKLEQAGTTLFSWNGDNEIDAECMVMNKALEQSNTGVFEEMVGIMTTLRNYEACQKMLRQVDEATSKMMDKLA